MTVYTTTKLSYGFTPVPSLVRQNIEIIGSRREMLDGYTQQVAWHHFRVNQTDIIRIDNGKSQRSKPFIEARIKDHRYSGGVHQFEGHVYVLNGTSGVAMMQLYYSIDVPVFQLIVHEGHLRCNERPLPIRKIYDKWHKVIVIHNADSGRIRVSINSRESF